VNQKQTEDIEFSPEIEIILGLLNRLQVHQNVGRAHDYARELFPVTRLSAAGATDFKEIVTEYVQHHVAQANGERLSSLAAFTLSMEILNEFHKMRPFNSGYIAALATGLGSCSGGLPDVLNTLAVGMKAQAVKHHLDYVFYNLINPLSTSDIQELAFALVYRFGETFSRLGKRLDELVITERPRDVVWMVRAELLAIYSSSDGV